MPGSKSLDRAFGRARWVVGLAWFGAVWAGALAQTAPSGAPTGRAQGAVSAPAAPGHAPNRPRPAEHAGPLEVGAEMNLTVSKSTLLRLPAPVDRISVGNPAIADVTLISGKELYLLGKAFGTTNVMLWRSTGGTTVIDVTVGIDTAALKTQLGKILPDEPRIEVQAASDSIVLSGTVSSALAAQQAHQVAEGFLRSYTRTINMPSPAPATAPGAAPMPVAMPAMPAAANANLQPKVINLLRVAQPMQVMLDVKVAEVSKTLLDKLGSALRLSRSSGGWTYGIVSTLLHETTGGITAIGANGKNLTIDGERRDGLVKILAEPNIVAISGQEASFLAGGKIFIPVARNNNAGVPTITLEEKEFGVGLKFLPTVLDGKLINLRVAPEVSELSQSGSPFTTVGGITAVLPSFTTRRAQTTVHLSDGQSLAIAGLIKNNVTETIRKLPVLGELPILGALFRSAEFQTDRTELLFIITPRLVKPLDQDVALPTDHFTPPSRGEFLLDGKLEGSGHADVPTDRTVEPGKGAPSRELELK